MSVPERVIVLAESSFVVSFKLTAVGASFEGEGDADGEGELEGETEGEAEGCGETEGLGVGDAVSESSSEEVLL